MFAPAHRLTSPRFVSALPLSTLAMATLLLATACGGSAAPDAEAPPSETSQEEPSEEDISDEEADLLAQIEESAAIADAEAGLASDKPVDDGDGPAEREVVYRVSQDALKVQIEGAEFIPRAKAVKVGGRWGVKLTVQATTTDKRLLFSSSQGPLAFGGIVHRGQKEKFGDKRDGGSPVSLSPGPAIEFSRTWPGEGQKGLLAGEELELQVGLWGFGSTAEDTRPVHKFVVVRVVASSSGATAHVQPPG